MLNADGQPAQGDDGVMRHGNSSDGMRGWRAAGPAALARRFALAMLVFLCYPAAQLAGAPPGAARLTVTLLATLLVVAIYLWLVWHRQLRDRLRCVAAVVIMKAAGVALPPAWGATWPGLLLFPAVGAALVLPAAAGVLTAAAATAAVLAAEGLALGAPGGLILSLGLVTILAGLAAAGYMRLAETSSAVNGPVTGVPVQWM